ncbi:MAG: hypothetical protein Q7T78_17115 [Rhodoferax sp.]|nr:hypothetical protein [Rhodoferax sp.]
MTCSSCNAARETNDLWRMYDALKCPHCAARLIKRIGALQIARSVATARMRAVLVDAVAWGQDEATIRAMVKDGPHHAPLAEKTHKAR